MSGLQESQLKVFDSKRRLCRVSWLNSGRESSLLRFVLAATLP